MAIVFLHGCGSSSDVKKFRNEVSLKCNSIFISKMQATCSASKRSSSETVYCDSGSFDKMSDQKLSKEMTSLNKQEIDCKKQMKNQELLGLILV